MASTASPSAAPSAKLNETGGRGKLPDVTDQDRSRRTVNFGKRAERYAETRTRLDVDVLQILGMRPELRLHFQNDVILVQLREQRRYLPLPERIVERVIDALCRDADAHRSLAGRY